MNDLYARERMERNNMDFEGSGVGSGRYDVRQERRERWSEAKLPLVLMGFCLICWAIVLYYTYTDILYYCTGEQVVTECDPKDTYTQWTAPDGNRYTINVEWGAVKEGKITVYYRGTDYRNAIVLNSPQHWVLFYGFVIFCTALLVFWIRKIFHKQHHAVQKTE